MGGVRAMLARVARLEQARSPAFPFGDFAAWEAECVAGMAAGLLDARDVPVVIIAVQRWYTGGLLTGR